ncbi:hypothetical protein [Salicola sp. Rm-C-2C1-2]|uniref:hypothetical protein n=1 Tax=Salicola sp. Rm-C-2C1-2 TaxID=3141321 RepID=UPI0032E3FBF7
MLHAGKPVIFLLALLVTAPVLAGTDGSDEAITLWKRNHDSPAIRELVKMVLAKTPDYGRTEIRPSLPMAQGRAIRNLRAGNTESVRIANVASSPDRNRTLRPIPIPIDQGMLGFRICLIRKGEQQRFDSIFSAGDFQRQDLTIGQGAHWPDTRILRSAGFEVITAPRFGNLLTMLERDRFDCFLRGVGEVLIDLDQYEGERLAVEDRLIFTYRMPSYLFVGPDDSRMAERIKVGLHRAMLSGDYDKWFNTYFRKPIRELDVMERVFIPLPNPFLEDGGSPAQLPLLPIRPEFLLTVPEGTR